MCHGHPTDNLPVAVIGGGPVGLAAAAQLIGRGLPVKLYEAGSEVGSNLRDWGHVRVFTPWRYCVDAVARKLLESHGWQMPEPEAFPTADEIVDAISRTARRTIRTGTSIETDARVVAVSRWGADKVLSKGREQRPFMLVVETADGKRRDSARAVIDASGTWQTPNPLGAGGITGRRRNGIWQSHRLRHTGCPRPRPSRLMPAARRWLSAPAIPPPMPCWNWPGLRKPNRAPRQYG